MPCLNVQSTRTPILDCRDKDIDKNHENAGHVLEKHIVRCAKVSDMLRVSVATPLATASPSGRERA